MVFFQGLNGFILLYSCIIGGQVLNYLTLLVLVCGNVQGFLQAQSKTTRTTEFLSFLYPNSYHPSGVYTACDSTRREVCSTVEGDQSELSLKGCQARRNPIQYQYRSTTGRAGELLGSAAVSLTVVRAAAACQPETPSHPIMPPYPTLSPKHRSGQTDGLSGQPSQGALTRR